MNPNKLSPKGQHIEIMNLIRERITTNDVRIVEVIEHNQYICKVTIEMGVE